LTEKLSKKEIEEIISEAVEIEDEFINDSIPCHMLGMNRDLMSQYIKFVADRLCIQLGYDPLFNIKNPFSFMDRISLNSKTNFFEHTRQSEYAIARVGNTAQENQFDLTADF
jgi:ribonucleotide reductase beta subunit family protein with ferritin-like domain